MKEFGVK
jgi:hypothetical protein